MFNKTGVLLLVSVCYCFQQFKGSSAVTFESLISPNSVINKRFGSKLLRLVLVAWGGGGGGGEGELAKRGKGEHKGLPAPQITTFFSNKSNQSNLVCSCNCNITVV